MKRRVTFRLGTATCRKLDKIARGSGISRSDAVQLAVAMMPMPEVHRVVTKPFDLIADLIGTVNGGDPGRSSNIGAKVTASLKARRAAANRKPD